MENAFTSHIENSVLLTSYFGSWPTFHDAAVISILIEREGPSVTSKLMLNEMGEDISSPDLLAYVILRWDEVDDISIQGVDSEENNWINGMKFFVDEDHLLTIIEEMDGTHGRIRAGKLSIIELIPIINNNG